MTQRGAAEATTDPGRPARPGCPGHRSPLGTALHRGLDLYRPLALLFVVAMVASSYERLQRPVVALAVVAVLAGWSLALLVVHRRDELVLGAELALVVGGVLLSPLAEGPRDVLGTLPSLWAAAPVMGWAALRGLRGGVLSALVVAVADVAEIGVPTQGTVYNIVTLLLLGGCLGACTDYAVHTQRAVEQALRVQAESAERERLARTIHDGVLQALAFIHRRGEELGGEAAELGELAAAQERALRSLALGLARPQRTDSRVDLGTLLTPLAGPTVSVAAPAEPVLLAADRGHELLAAVQAALDNVEQHAGPGARAYVLVEDLGPEVVVTVRDDGCGYPPGRLEQAAAAGRLGVASCVDGRVRDLGGSVLHRSTPGHGTTVEMTVPTTSPTTARTTLLAPAAPAPGGRAHQTAPAEGR